jgi:membrane associated rhomboid family serine protease
LTNSAIVSGAYFYLFLPVWDVPFNAHQHGNSLFIPAWALEYCLWEDDVLAILLFLAVLSLIAISILIELPNSRNRFGIGFQS